MAWEKVGSLANLDECLASHPATDFELSVQSTVIAFCRGRFPPLHVTSWNQCVADVLGGYFHFVSSTNRRDSWNLSFQHIGKPSVDYICSVDPQQVQVFARRRLSKWQRVGTLKQLVCHAAGDYPWLQFKFGIKSNGSGPTAITEIDGDQKDRLCCIARMDYGVDDNKRPTAKTVHDWFSIGADDLLHDIDTSAWHPWLQNHGFNTFSGENLERALYVQRRPEHEARISIDAAVLEAKRLKDEEHAAALDEVIRLKHAETEAAVEEAHRLKDAERIAAVNEATRLKDEERTAAVNDANRLKDEEWMAVVTEAKRLKDGERRDAVNEVTRLKDAEREAAVYEANRLKDEERMAAVSEANRLKDEERVAAVSEATRVKDVERMAAVSEANRLKDEQLIAALIETKRLKDEERIAAVNEARRLKDEEQAVAVHEASRLKDEDRNRLNEETAQATHKEHGTSLSETRNAMHAVQVAVLETKLDMLSSQLVEVKQQRDSARGELLSARGELLDLVKQNLCSSRDASFPIAAGYAEVTAVSSLSGRQCNDGLRKRSPTVHEAELKKDDSDTCTESNWSLILAPASMPDEGHCFPKDAWFKKVNGQMVQAIHLRQFDYISSSHGGTLQVMSVRPFQAKKLVYIQADNAVLFVTPTHRVMVSLNGEPVAAGSLSVGDSILLTGGIVKTIDAVEKIDYEGEVLDITFNPDEAVEAYFLPEQAILTKGSQSFPADFSRPKEHSKSKTRRGGNYKRGKFTAKPYDATSLVTNDSWR